VFIEKVIALHPEADGKPCVIGNCQAGWAIMILARCGRSCSARSSSPARRFLLGGRARQISDALFGRPAGRKLADRADQRSRGGKFDGAWLVQNFESQNPSNTLWTKQYNVYSKVDTEAERYLEFERWWGGHVNLNAEEIQFIVDELFVGNNLAAGRSRCPTAGGRPAQHPLADRGVLLQGRQRHAAAAGAALDPRPLRRRRRDRAYGQTIVYTVHEPSAISASSSPAASPRRSTPNSPAISI
jgi:hypothetical protein